MNVPAVVILPDSEWQIEVDDSVDSIAIPHSTAQFHGFKPIVMTRNEEKSEERGMPVFTGPVQLLPKPAEEILPPDSELFKRRAAKGKEDHVQES